MLWTGVAYRYKGCSSSTECIVEPVEHVEYTILSLVLCHVARRLIALKPFLADISGNAKMHYFSQLPHTWGLTAGIDLAGIHLSLAVPHMSVHNPCRCYQLGICPTSLFSCQMRDVEI